MHNFISLLLTVASVVVACCTAHSETTNKNLAFYVVSKTSIEGGKFIDTLDMPKLGYISSKPDLVVTNVQAVLPRIGANIVIKPDKDGGTNWITPNELNRGLVVILQPDDAKIFITLTGRSVGKEMLVMLGDKPLSSWETKAKFPEGRIDIQFQNQADLKTTEYELKKLVP